MNLSRGGSWCYETIYYGESKHVLNNNVHNIDAQTDSWDHEPLQDTLRLVLLLLLDCRGGSSRLLLLALGVQVVEVESGNHVLLLEEELGHLTVDDRRDSANLLTPLQSKYNLNSYYYVITFHKSDPKRILEFQSDYAFL